MRLPHRTLAIALGCATLLKLYLALATQGSYDVAGFLDHLEKIRALGVGAYRVRGAFDNPFNSPPAMIHVIRLWGWLADTTGVQFRFWLRLPSVLADVISFLLVMRLLDRLWPDRRHYGVLLALALCPAAIIISGYHGNTDSLMICLALLSIYLIETGRAAWLAGLVFGLALNVKIVPLMFAPAIYFYLPHWRARSNFFGVAALTFALCSLPYLAQDPRAIWATVFGYGSIYGFWGWTQLAALTFPEPPVYAHTLFDVQGTHAVFARILKYATLALICALAIYLNRRAAKPSLYLQCGLVTALCLFMAPGFGSQYLLWLVPFVPALGLRFTLLFYVVSGLYLAGVYLCYAVLFCWWPLNVPLWVFACWLSLFVLILAFRRALHTSMVAYLFRSDYSLLSMTGNRNW